MKFMSGIVGRLSFGLVLMMLLLFVYGCADAPEPTPSVSTPSTPQGAVIAGDVPQGTLNSSSAPLLDTELSANEQSLSEQLRRSSWNTDFTRRVMPLTDFLSGSVGRDQGIRPVDSPEFVDQDEAPSYLQDDDPVVVFRSGEVARAYPLAVLTAHEIVNDSVNGVPVAVTFCPLCNSAIVFSRLVDGQELTFGVSGLLYNSDLVMWDRQTESWWQQFTGIGLVGEYARAQLAFLPSQILSWEEFRKAYPSGQVLDGPRGNGYMTLPYAGYDSSGRTPFLYDGEYDPRLEPTARVLALNLDDTAVAYDWDYLTTSRVVNDQVGSSDVTIFFDPDTRSTFPTGGGDRLAVGSATAFSPIVDGATLSFAYSSGVITDEQTGSTWNFSGVATSGELVGERLEPLIAGNHFWFAWAAFNPLTEVRP